jgi:hypothetical protein
MKKLSLLALLAASIGQAQVVRKYANEFLEIGAGARGLAMGGAVLSSQNDVYAPMWNPAGLSQVKNDWQAAIMHAEYFATIAKYDYMAYAKALENGAVGLSLVRFGIDDIQNTTQLIDGQGNIDYSRISKFSTADYAGLVTYAMAPNENLKLGANAKFLYRNVGKFANAFGFGLDFGCTYQDQNDILYSAVLKDALSTISFWYVNEKELSSVVNGSDVNPAPTEKMEVSLPKLKLGVSRRFELDAEAQLYLWPEVGAAVDFARTNAIVSGKGFSLSPMAGVEFSYLDTIFIRGGINQFQNVPNFEDDSSRLVAQPSAGVGIKYMGLQLDYAISNAGVGGVGRFSNFFSLKFDMSKFK